MGLKKKAAKKVVRAATRAVAAHVTPKDLRLAAVAGAARWAGRRIVRKLGRKVLLKVIPGAAVASVAVPAAMYVGRKVMGRGKTAEAGA